MPETQIRRPDGSDTTIPELLQELAAKEAAGASRGSGKNLDTQEHSVPQASDERMPQSAGRRLR